MTSGLPCVLTTNRGSSSIRFATCGAETAQRQPGRTIDRIGSTDPRVIVNDPPGTPQVSPTVAVTGHRTARALALGWLGAQLTFASEKTARRGPDTFVS